MIQAKKQLSSEAIPPVDEPSAAVAYQSMKERVHQRLVSSLDLASIERVDDPAVREEVERLSRQIIKESGNLTPGTCAQLYKDLQDELFRLGPLEKFLSDPAVSDILVNGPNEVYIERNGKLTKTRTVFADEKHLVRIIQRVVGSVGRRIDRSCPLVDARLPDGSRVNAVLPPLSLDGPKLSIRRFVPSHFNLDVLCACGSMTRNMSSFLQAAVEARISILFSGGTGAGKTTLLSALAGAIPHSERLVTIEDSAELVLQHPHVVRMETRPSNQEGSGEYTVRDLVRNSLRMRPDRIIVGEVRGAEAIDMIQAMNTGHEGSMTTVHANGTKDALARLELMMAMARIDLPTATVREFIAQGIPLVVHLARMRDGMRRITRISEYVSDGKGNIEVQDVFRFVSEGVSDQGEVLGHFESARRLPNCLDKIREQGVALESSVFTSVKGGQ